MTRVYAVVPLALFSVCSPRRPEKELASLQPWMEIKVTEKVDAAIEEVSE